jgi:hypothetical protein
MTLVSRPRRTIVERRARACLACLACLACPSVTRLARAEESNAEPSGGARAGGEVSTSPFATKPGYVQLMATALGGTGLRFNNPYRLATPLGRDAESVARSASFVELGFGGTFGNPLGLQHGVTVRTSVAIEGVSQLVMTPSYLAYRRWGAFAAWARAGVPFVLTPDATLGLEAAAGSAWFFRGGLGLAAELVSDVFYGAGTTDVRVATYPMLSAQLGLLFAYEVLP